MPRNSHQKARASAARTLEFFSYKSPYLIDDDDATSPSTPKIAPCGKPYQVNKCDDKCPRCKAKDRNAMNKEKQTPATQEMKGGPVDQSKTKSKVQEEPASLSKSKVKGKDPANQSKTQAKKEDPVNQSKTQVKEENSANESKTQVKVEDPANQSKTQVKEDPANQSKSKVMLESQGKSEVPKLPTYRPPPIANRHKAGSTSTIPPGASDIAMAEICAMMYEGGLAQSETPPGYTEYAEMRAAGESVLFLDLPGLPDSVREKFKEVMELCRKVIANSKRDASTATPSGGPETVGSRVHVERTATDFGNAINELQGLLAKATAQPQTVKSASDEPGAPPPCLNATSPLPDIANQQDTSTDEVQRDSDSGDGKTRPIRCLNNHCACLDCLMWRWGLKVETETLRLLERMVQALAVSGKDQGEAVQDFVQTVLGQIRSSLRSKPGAGNGKGEMPSSDMIREETRQIAQELDEKGREIIEAGTMSSSPSKANKSSEEGKSRPQSSNKMLKVLAFLSQEPRLALLPVPEAPPLQPQSKVASRVYGIMDWAATLAAKILVVEAESFNEIDPVVMEKIKDIVGLAVIAKITECLASSESPQYGESHLQTGHDELPAGSKPTRELVDATISAWARSAGTEGEIGDDGGNPGKKPAMKFTRWSLLHGLRSVAMEHLRSGVTMDDAEFERHISPDFLEAPHRPTGVYRVIRTDLLTGSISRVMEKERSTNTNTNTNTNTGEASTGRDDPQNRCHSQDNVTRRWRALKRIFPDLDWMVSEVVKERAMKCGPGEGGEDKGEEDLGLSLLVGDTDL